MAAMLAIGTAQALDALAAATTALQLYLIFIVRITLCLLWEG
jgi:hypothetical protein